jgi:hypothetical protein
MRRLIPASALAASLLALVPVSGGPRAEAAATGTIRGRVVNETTGEPQPDVELILTTGTDEGSGEVVETVRSDVRGHYRFDGLATGEDRFYALDARHAGGLFAGRPITLPSDTARRPVVDSTMRVWDTTTDPAVIVVQRDDLFAIASENGLGVIESVTILNSSDLAYIGRGTEMLDESASGVSLAFALPAGASDVSVFDSDLDMPEIVVVDQGFGTTVAFPPGETRTTFSYRIPGVGGSFDLSRPALYTTLELSIFAAPPLDIESNRLRRAEGVTLEEGQRYERWTAPDPIAAGDPLQALAIARSTASSLPLIATLAGVLVVMTGIFLGTRARRRRAPRPPERDILLEQVAKLDLDFGSGAIHQPAYDDRRAELIGRLKDLERQR